jgi:hypothetical protein
MEDDPWGEEFSDEALSISSDDGKGQEKEFDPLAKNKHRYSEKDFRLEEDMSDVRHQKEGLGKAQDGQRDNSHTKNALPCTSTR